MLEGVVIHNTFPKQTFFLSCISHILSQSTISLFGKELMTMKKDHLKTLWEKNNLVPFSIMISFQPRTNILLSANAFVFGQCKHLLFSKELMTRIKKNENFVVEEQSHNQQRLIQQCFPSNQGH